MEKKNYSADHIDPLTQLPKTLKLLPNDNNLIFYLAAQTYKKEQIEYELFKNEKLLNAWRKNEFDNNFIWLKNLSSGQYLIKIRYSAQRQNVTPYTFEIPTAWYQSVWFKVLSDVLILAFIGFIIVTIKLFEQRQQAEKELSKKTKLQLEIKTIHSQLNPHFVFNALNSIQGLINKQDIAGANKYLSAFGQLMRNSLSNSERDQITLLEEVKILETYLKLEQLRFGFEYHINIHQNINVYETEIPSLLLQPLIENGIKHGISGLKQQGIITLDFIKTDNDMMVNIKDNGKGFLLTEKYTGYGLKLTKDRIKLLNQMMKEQSVDFEIQTSPGKSTIIIITFKNWFT